MDSKTTPHIDGRSSETSSTAASQTRLGKEDEKPKELIQWWSDQEDLKVRTKLDFRILPLIFLAYGMAALDRSNIGNAKQAGLNSDLNISDSEYQFLLTIFYISYTLFQWLCIMYNIVPPHLWISFNVFFWGVCSITQATATNWASLVAARFFLGIFEAGFGTGMALYLTSFYPRREVGFRFAIYAASSAIASAIGGALAYGLQQASAKIAPWKVILLVEGAPPLILAPIIFFLLPDTPSTASFLTPRERLIAEQRRFLPNDSEKPAQDEPASSKATQIFGSWGKIDWKASTAAFKDPMSYVSAILLFCINTSYSSIPVYLPTILKDNGYTALKAQGLTAPPYLVAFISALIVVYISDRTGVRSPCLAISLVISAVGYVMLATIKDQTARYGAVFVVTLGLFTSIPLSYMVLLSNQTGRSHTGIGLAIFGTIGQLGPFLGTEGLYGEEDSPFYTKSTSISAGIAFFAGILAAATAFSLHLANRKRDRKNPIQDEGVEKKEEIRDRRVDGLDLRGAEDRFEFERRLTDVAREGKRSIYFRYVI